MQNNDISENGSAEFINPYLKKSLTFPSAHSVPSTGGPFLVLQKYWLSGWLHHSCLQGSQVRNQKKIKKQLYEHKCEQSRIQCLYLGCSEIPGEAQDCFFIICLFFAQLCLLKETFLWLWHKIAFYSDVLRVVCFLRLALFCSCIIYLLPPPPPYTHLANESKYSRLCTSCNRHQNQSGTAHPLNNLFRAAQEAWATCARRDHPEGSRRS